MGKRGPNSEGGLTGQTGVLSTRVTPELRSLLKAAADQRGKTIAWEVEFRLRRSFEEDEKIIEAFGDRKNYALMRAISMVIEMWHNPADLSSDWRVDPLAYDQVCRKIAAVLKAMRPPGRPQKLTALEQMLADGSASEHPAVILSAIKYAEEMPPLSASRRKRVLSSIKNDLAEMLDRPHTANGSADDLRAEADRIDAAGARSSQKQRSLRR